MDRRGWCASLALVLTSCGSGGGGPPADPAESTCKPEERGSATPGDLEAALTTSLREEAGIEAIFGDRTQAILDQADALRVEAAREATAGIGLPAPDSDQLRVRGFCAAGLTAQAWAFRELAMAHAVASLPPAIDALPISGTREAVGTRASETGDPIVTATYNAYEEGDGKSAVAVEVRGVVNIASPTKGSIHEDNEARVAIDVCPDENGHVNGKVHFKFGGVATPAGRDPFSYGATMDSDFRFELDDDAEIARTVIDSAMSYRTTGASAANVAGHGSVTFTGSRVTAIDLAWDHQEGSLSSLGTVQREIFSAALMAAVVSEDKARSRWRNGTCVEIRTDREGGSVRAHVPVSLTATARQKLLGQDIEANLQGWLEGAQSLSPNTQRVPSPATYQYTPGDDMQTGTVHLESVSKRGIGKKDLVFTATGGGWTGQVTWSVSGSDEFSDAMWTKTWTASGDGKIQVAPGPFNTAAVASATFTYSQQYHGAWHSEYEQNGCQHSNSQTDDENLSGTGTEGAQVALVQTDDTHFELIASVPYGTIMGTWVTDAADVVTGPPERCSSPAPTHNSTESTAPLPSGSFQVTVVTSDPSSVSGSKSVHTDGTPPLDWEFSFAISR